jgi:type I restriction enzyme, S subunit
MTDLKPGWKRVALGDVADVITDYWDRDPSRPERFVAGEHIDEGTLRVCRWGMTDDDLVPPTFNRRFKAGDVLFHSRNIRKLAQPDFGGITGEKIFVLRTRDPLVLIQELLPFLLQMTAFSEYTERMWAGSTNKFLNKAPLVRYEFALPPLDEQRAIIALLKSALRAHEALVSSSHKAVKTIQALREEHIAACRAKCPLQAIRDLSKIVTKGESPRWQGYSYCDEGVRFITSENVLDGHLSLFPGKFLPLEFDNKLQRSRLEVGDILVNIVGGSIGRICAVPEGVGRANINQAVALIRPDPVVLYPGYLLSVLLAPSAKHALCSKKVDDYKPNLSLAVIRGFQVSLPPLDIQKAHVTCIQSVSNCISSLEARSRKNQHLLSDLLSISLLGSIG